MESPFLPFSPHNRMSFEEMCNVFVGWEKEYHLKKACDHVLVGCDTGCHLKKACDVLVGLESVVRFSLP